MNISMKELQVSRHNLQEAFDLIQKDLGDGVLLVSWQEPTTGKWGMSRLWRAWMSTTAKWMAERGATMPLMVKSDGSHYGERPFNENDAHLLFTCHHLGTDENGVRLSWAKSDHDGMRKATKGERFNALRKHENWAIDKGLQLFKPRDSEYTRIEQEQDK